MKNILLGVSSSIACYKALDICSNLSKDNNVNVVMTKNTTNFINPLSFFSISGNKCFVDQFDDNLDIPHIKLSKADIMLIAPATANIIAKLANGIADDLLTSIALAFTKDIYIAPAMNTNMYLSEITQENINKLSKRKNIHFIYPQSGLLACKDEGIGKLADVDKICKIIRLHNYNEKINKKVLVISGPTKEKIDSVRCITNISSGKMGNCLADSFYSHGLEVTFLTSIKPKIDIYHNTVLFESTNDIFEYVTKNYMNFDIIISPAAISDIKANIVKNKLKKDMLLTKDNYLNVKFEKNPDLLEFLGNNKLDNQILVGFAAETDNILENAKIKLDKKKCDYIILNDVSNNDIGFNSDENEVYIISKNNIIKLEKENKEIIANKIAAYILKK